MLKAGVIGVGHLGNFHAQKYLMHQGTELVGVFDIDETKAKDIANKYDTKAFKSINELISSVDIVSIATPATCHYEPSILAIKNSVHVLVEKPFTHDIDEANKIVELASKNNIYVQVGFLERFNSVLKELKSSIDHPLFAECHRLSAFTGRSVDIDVIKDIMIHDIDLVLSIFGSDIVSIDAVGAPILTNQIDIAQAKLEFSRGRIVNLTASRVSNKIERKMRLFQKNKYIGLDFQNSSFEVCGKNDGKIIGDKKQIAKADSLYDEIDYFINVVNGNSEKIKIDDAVSAIKISDIISEKINNRLNLLWKEFL